MATRSVKMLLLLVPFSMSIWNLAAGQANDDEVALLAFKAAATSGSSDDPLASWNRSTGQYCSWEGVRCGGRHRRVVELSLPSHGLTGFLSPAVGNLSSLRVLNLTTNRLSGAIPASLGRLRHLRALNLSLNGFSGELPANLTSCTRLAVLGLQSNQLHGRIPSDLGKLTRLETLILWQNRLTGAIPATLGNMSSLGFLSLAFNQLEGTIPPGLGGIAGLHKLDLAFASLNNLVLSGNQLSGEIPDSIGDCAVLQGLWLDHNSFEGSIPQSLNKIKGLSTLNLSLNKLYGAIPDAIGGIHNLGQLNLAYNNLSGTIPTSLQNLILLSELDLSFNNLQGEVPKEGIFRYLTKFSITGNNELSFIIAIVQFIKKKSRGNHGPILSPVIEEQYERVSYHALANGTNGFSEANLLGKGSFGAVYKCTFADDETIAAVKVFNLQQPGSTRTFVAECEALRRVRHRCLVKIITCCSSINHQGQEFKALIFEFMSNGSLNDWLHPKSDLLTPRNTLSLEQRLNIATNIMDALDYLHYHCEPPIAHCDLKPSNILLAEDMSARVGDFGISQILPESASKILQNSNSTIGIRGSIGYVAPEYGEGSAVSTTGDVYSLGILLLEMFTGRSPTDDMFGDMLDLHKYSTLWLHLESTDSIIRSRVKDCLVSVFRLAISCSKQHPKERTPMRDAVVEMHAIRDSYHMFSC
uniref:Receptor kinase-like protein Xa21 n=1 Tax=Saccharum hybrid cultivar R570 TaxID=131158 RepID=A0A059PYR7_9POAL|nr:LRR-kinase protein [Saccharum hybrid cultivar R570]